MAYNIIRESISVLASPTVLAPKPNGTLRLFVDYRRLNNITVNPIIDEIFPCLHHWTCTQGTIKFPWRKKP